MLKFFIDDVARDIIPCFRDDATTQVVFAFWRLHKSIFKFLAETNIYWFTLQRRITKMALLLRRHLKLFINIFLNKNRFYFAVKMQKIFNKKMHTIFFVILNAVRNNCLCVYLSLYLLTCP